MGNKKKYGVRYPWKTWFNPGKTVLRRGSHYSVRTDSMAQACRFAAKRLGVKVHISIADDGCSLTVVTEPSKEAPDAED